MVETLAREDCWGEIAFAEGEPAGHVTFNDSLRSRWGGAAGLAHVWWLFVRPPWWGSGLAARLLSDAVAEMRARGFERARLFTPREQRRARRFYEREGWAPTGVEEGPEHALGLNMVEYAREL
jgi:GNAT superfamily N-acetyltransferase